MGKKTKEKLRHIELEEEKFNISFKSHNLNNIKLSYKNGMSYYNFMSICDLDYPKLFIKELNCIIKTDKINSWKLKNKSETKAIEDLINYSFCRYKYPSFFKCMFFKSIFDEALFQYDNVTIKKTHIENKIFSATDKEFLDFFECIISGKSLYKEYFQFYDITKKETFIFITCNLDYIKTPQHALLYAFLYSALEQQNKKHEIKKYFDLLNNSKKIQGLYSFSTYSFYKTKFIKDVISFLCKYDFNEVKDGFFEYMDFLNSKINENFSLKNRTLNSIKQLSNEWHIGVINRKYLNSDIENSWASLFNEKIWIESEDFNNSYSLWKCVELTNAKEIIDEGRKQKHCVANYISTCKSGLSHIFTMFKPNESRITLEVKNYNNLYILVQARKKYNYPPNNEDKAIIKKWCKEKNISYKNHLK